jgi:hypothetical protein
LSGGLEGHHDTTEDPHAQEGEARAHLGAEHGAATRLTVDSGSILFLSLGGTPQSAKIQKLPKTSTRPSNRRPTLFHLLAATAGQEDKSSARATLKASFDKDKGAGRSPLHQAALPLATVAGRKRISW